MMAIVYLALTVGACWGARRLGMPSVNGISAFMVPWSAALCLASLPGVLEPAMAAMTWTMILVATVSLVVGVIAGWVLAKPGGVSKPTSQRAEIDVRNLARWHWIFVAALVSYAFLQIAKLLPVFAEQGGWEALLTGNGSTLKMALLEAAAESADTMFGTVGLLIALLGYVLFLGNLSLFTGVFLLRAGRPFAAMVPLVVAVLYSLVSLQRSTFVIAALVMGTSWLVVHMAEKGGLNWKSIFKFRHMSKTTIAAAILMTGAGLVALLYPLVVRNTGTHNPKGFTSLANYFVSGIAGLNVRTVENPHWSAPVVDGVAGPMPGLGSYTFSGLFNILARLGIPVPQSPTNLDFYHVVLFGTNTTTNVNTNLGDYFLDFGWAGVVVISFVFALLVGYLQRRYVDSGKIVFLPPVVFLLVSSIWSFFTGSLPGDFRFIMVCTAGALLLHWALTRQAPPGRTESELIDVRSLEGPS